jgi:hypothetical protein
MPLGGAALGLAPGQFYNAAVSAASVEDHIALWQLLKRGGRAPRLAVFSIDHWALDRTQEQVRWLALSGEVSQFLEDAGRGPGRGWAVLHGLAYRWARFKELFSYTVLKTSLRDLERAARGRARRGGEVEASLRRDVVAEGQVGDRRAVRADGSLIYDRAYDGQTAEQVRESAVRFARAGARGLAGFQVDPERLARLELLWRDMRAQGVELIVYLPPYHPAAWALIRAEPRAASALAAGAAAVAALAARLGARFLDASDPASIPCGAEQFYDGDHARVECLRVVIQRLLAAPPPGPGVPKARVGLRRTRDVTLGSEAVAPAQEARGHARDDAEGGHVRRDNRPGADDASFSDRHPREDHRVGPDVGPRADPYRPDREVGLNDGDVRGLAVVLRTKDLGPRTPPHEIAELQVARVEEGLGAYPDTIAHDASTIEPPLQTGLGADDHAVAQVEGLEVLEDNSTADVKPLADVSRQRVEEHATHHGVEIAITLSEAREQLEKGVPASRRPQVACEADLVVGVGRHRTEPVYRSHQPPAGFRFG